MIILSEVAQKLEKILNSADEETSSSVNPLGNKFLFQVETEGFHIDHICAPIQISMDENGQITGAEQRNFIPVFISSMGGQFNPVKGIKQGSYVIPIDFYFPVRFKDDFFALCEYLVDVFVGTKLNYGIISGRAVSNISVPQFGEIQGQDLKQFPQWVQENYKKPISIMEPYLSMRITLYLNNAAQGLIYGNDITIDLSYTYDGVTQVLENVDWDGASLQSNSQPQSEQEEGGTETDSIPFSTSYSSSFKIYPNLDTPSKDAVTYSLESGTYDANAEYYTKSGDTYTYVGKISESTYNGYHSGGILLYTATYNFFYRDLVKIWLDGNIQEVSASVTFHVGDPSYGLTYTRECFIPSVVVPFEKGQLFSITFTFAKKVSE